MPTESLQNEWLSIGNERLDNSWILKHRGAKNKVDPTRPYAWLVEPERAANGSIQQTGTVFLTNRECPFKCLMCDLWKNTTDFSVSPTDLQNQLEFALNQFDADLGEAERVEQLKLYNSGNFFDPKAIDPAALPSLAKVVNQRTARQNLSNLVIENHPRLVGPTSIEFGRQLDCSLEIAMGLETVQSAVLQKLNKQMTLSDFERATSFLIDQGFAVRSFILLKTPFQSELEGVEQALRAIEFAFSIGVHCCAVIPTRTGNGALDQLELQGLFSEPRLSSLETVIGEGLLLSSGQQRVFVDLWDAQRFSTCPDCLEERIARMNRMNLSQQFERAIECSQCSA